jgi:hypothetical protein
MISAHSLASRIRRPHRRPDQRRSHHDAARRPPLRSPGRGAFFADCTPDDDVEQVVLIPDRPRLFWPQVPGEGYRLQRSPEHQSALAAERAIVERGDCRFTATSILSSGEAIEGEWDFRGREEPYLGATDFSRQSVLHLRPGSGYFTFHMERHGAEVVGFDWGYDCVPDVMPEPGDGGHPRATPTGTVAFHAHSAMRELSEVQNSWWYLHRDYRSSAEMVYGDLARPPSDLGAFDVAVLGQCLSQVRDPWGVISWVASCTRRRLVATEVLDPNVLELSRSVGEHACVYAPKGPAARSDWWSLSPGSVADAMRCVGFTRTRVVFHSQRKKVGDAWSEVPMFTVVGEREWVF